MNGTWPKTAAVAKAFSQGFALCLAGGAISQILQRLSGFMYWYLTIFAVLFIIATTFALYWEVYDRFPRRRAKKVTDEYEFDYYGG